MRIEGSLRRLAAIAEAPLRAIAAMLALLVLLLVAMQCAVVALRYGFGYSQPWLRESVLAANAVIFLFGAAWTLLRDEHVRVDVLSRRFSERSRQAIECLGMLLAVLPFAVFILVVSEHYVATSFRIGERSPEPGGLRWLWLQKALIPSMALLLALAALARAARAAAAWLELAPRPERQAGDAQ